MKQQVYFYLGALVLLPLLPVLYWLGKRVWRQVPALPEAQLRQQDTTAGNEPAWQLLTLGEPCCTH